MRIKNVNGVNVPLTAEEEAARDADEAAWAADQPARDAEAGRRAAIKADALRANMLSYLANATAAQISTYVDNNVIDLASARTMFKRVLLLISLDQRDGT